MYDPEPLDDDTPESADPSWEPPEASPEAHRAARTEALVQLALGISLVAIPWLALKRVGIYEWVATHAPAWHVPSVVFAQGLTALAAIAITIRLRKSNLTSLGLHPLKHRAQAILRGLSIVGITYAFMIPVMLATTLLLQGPAQQAMVQRKAQSLGVFVRIPMLMVLPCAIMAGVYEEVLVRGFLQSRLARLFAGAKPLGLSHKSLAVLLGSLLFALAHLYQGAMGVMQTLLVGLILGTCATTWRSLWPAIIAHITIDTIGLLASRYLVPTAQRMIDRS
ncbi:MAG: CPBP family intramembrane metalloprotease [Deltaproteobacteria bacterium]|nr:CPBP family intramembrane metalloprotease [Deltaproteobacteria bacterium]